MSLEKAEKYLKLSFIMLCVSAVFQIIALILKYARS